MTYGEAKALGYETYETRFAAGYLSRKIDVDAQPVETAGGSRRGELYVDVPNYGSTRYHYRLYIRKPEGVQA